MLGTCTVINESAGEAKTLAGVVRGVERREVRFDLRAIPQSIDKIHAGLSTPPLGKGQNVAKQESNVKKKLAAAKTCDSVRE
jgi:hypothetical protein